MSESGALKRWAGFAVFLILLALWVARPLGVQAPANIDTPFDEHKAIARLATILGDQRPHPTDSDANDAVTARLIAEIEKDGFTPIVTERFHCNDVRESAAICSRPRNIAFWVTPPGDDAVMLTAHHDSVASGPGAADDGMGMAIALEVARLLKGKKLNRPLLILITDAEEAGLIGAAAFAAHDPLRKRVGAIINVESRGTTGGANMFQTSRPNGRDIAALIVGGNLGAANSLATDFYETLPNDSDLTMYLPLGTDAANYAIIGGGKRYHTPLDNLAHLDPRSVRDMGASALGAVTGFADEPAAKDEGRYIFTDVARAFTLILPEWGAATLVLFGTASALLLFVRMPGSTRWRAAVTPLAAIVAGLVGAFATAWLIGTIRSGEAFGTAYPIAARFAYAAVGLTVAALVVRSLKEQSGVRLAAAAWIWLGLLVLGVFAFLPGLSILAAWPMIFVIAAAAASLKANAQFLVKPLLLAAAAVFLLIALPMAGGLEEGLFVEQAAPTIFLLVLMYLALMPVGAPPPPRLAAVGAVLSVAGIAAALAVPAFTRDAPRHLTVVHEDAKDRAAFLIEANGPLPPAMRAAAKFAAKPDAKGNWSAPAPRLPDDGTVEVRSDVTVGKERRIVLVLKSPSADQQELRIKEGEGVKIVRVNDALTRSRGVPFFFICSGRSCRELEIELVLTTGKPLPQIDWRRTSYGAGNDAKVLVAGRPPTMQPVHSGDRRVIVRPITLP